MRKHPVFDDLNDLRFYAAVVEHRGFSAAARALALPKSRLSKRVALLEERLGVRLLQRTTRRFVVTDVGERFYAHCRAMLEEARAAQEAVDELRAEPRGLVRVSCPVSLAQTLMATLLPHFMARYPQVQVRLLSSNRRVDVVGEGYDIAIRVRSRLDSEGSLVLRTLGEGRVLLVASPDFLAGREVPQRPVDLAALPLLSIYDPEGVQTLDLVDRDGITAQVQMRPRLICDDFAVMLQAARTGLGVATLPETVCAAALASGELVHLLPGWSMPVGILHFVYASRRGLLPSVRAFVDFLAERLPPALAGIDQQCSGTCRPAD